MNRYIDNKHNCTYAGGQFIILSSIFAAILSQEIESLEDLELLAAFLIAVADELALAIIARSQCESKYNEGENQIVEIVADKEGYIENKEHRKTPKKFKKKVIKRVVKYNNLQEKR